LKDIIDPTYIKRLGFCYRRLKELEQYQDAIDI
jgi:hypothetical protein